MRDAALSLSPSLLHVFARFPGRRGNRAPFSHRKRELFLSIRSCATLARVACRFVGETDFPKETLARLARLADDSRFAFFYHFVAPTAR